MSVRLSALPSAWNTLSPAGRIFIIFVFEFFFEKSVRRNLVLLEPEKNDRYFTWIPVCTFMLVRRWILLRMRNVLGKSCRENQNTFYFYLFIFFLNSVVYDILWENILYLGRSQTTTWRLFTARWIPQATNTYSEYVIIIPFPRQQWLCERASMLCYMYIAPLAFLSFLFLLCCFFLYL
jgi:hypothetical protein